MPAKIDPERETGVPCPTCHGKGRLLTESGTSYAEAPCALCHGHGWLTMSEWRAAKLAGRLLKP
jgi:DnaJ-class molecular chaperone